jgi:hypothetical protein
MAIRIPFLAAVPLGLLLAVSAWGQATHSGPDPSGASAPPSSSSPTPRKPRINQNQDNDARDGAITPSTPGTSRTPGTPGAIGTPDHPGA